MRRNIPLANTSVQSGLSDEDCRPLGGCQFCQPATQRTAPVYSPASLGALGATLLADEAGKLSWGRTIICTGSTPFPEAQAHEGQVLPLCLALGTP
jgi:hypothetical protein